MFMEFKIYPNPEGDCCTPFAYIPEKKRYYRYYYSDDLSLNLISIFLSNNTNFPQVRVSGIKKEILIGKRLQNRKKINDFIICSKFIKKDFLNYFYGTFVIPTFALSIDEALVKTIIRQIITAKQAKKMFSIFTKHFGFHNDGTYSFPNLLELGKITAGDLKKLGFGIKAERICLGISLLRSKHGEEITTMSGIGPWSKEILQVEKNKDFSFYPFWDKSGDRIKEKLAIDLREIAERDRNLAGDLYIYAASYLESIK